VYTPEQMSNEDYHSEAEHVSGSALCTIHEFSPAHWRFGDKKETPALEFGIASHAALLEPDKFASEFVRGLDKDDYPNALTSDAAMKSWLKERGIKGYSTKTKQELVEMIRKTGEDVDIWAELQSEFNELHSDKIEVKPQWF